MHDNEINLPISYFKEQCYQNDINSTTVITIRGRRNWAWSANLRYVPVSGFTGLESCATLNAYSRVTENTKAERCATFFYRIGLLNLSDTINLIETLNITVLIKFNF